MSDSKPLNAQGQGREIGILVIVCLIVLGFVALCLAVPVVAHLLGW